MTGQTTADGQLDLFAAVAEHETPAHIPGHRFQRVGICQCLIRTNNALSGLFESLDRVGVDARLRMTSEQHAQHLRELVAA